MIYLELFFSFLQIGMFSFGGGYAAMPLIQEQVVSLHKWLSQGEFVDLVTISQMTPGPIAVNAATFVGSKVAGIGGSLVATFGCIFPSCILVTGLAWLYLRYRSLTLLQGVLETLRPAVVAMIATAGISVVCTAFWGNGQRFRLTNLKPDAVVLFTGAIFLLKKKRLNPVLVMVLCSIGKVLLECLRSG